MASIERELSEYIATVPHATLRAWGSRAHTDYIQAPVIDRDTKQQVYVPRGSIEQPLEGIIRIGNTRSGEDLSIAFEEKYLPGKGVRHAIIFTLSPQAYLQQRIDANAPGRYTAASLSGTAQLRIVEKDWSAINADRYFAQLVKQY